MNLKNKYLEGTKRILEANAREKKSYHTNVSGKEFIVRPNVFSPEYFFDTEFFANEIVIRPGEQFLEVGSGTGAVSVLAALKGAKRVVAIDINPSAVRNTKENTRLHGVSRIIKVYQGDVYSPLKTGEQFDTIFWNVPFGYVTIAHLTDLERAVFDPNYRSITKFLAEADTYLKPGGRLLIGFSTTLGHISLLKKIAQQTGFKLKLLKENESIEVHPVKFQLYNATHILSE